ncbi:MAG: hypothetical protein ACQESC_01125 [Nanobdellota archaeon]
MSLSPKHSFVKYAVGLASLVLSATALSQEYEPHEVFESDFSEQVAGEETPGNFSFDVSQLEDSLDVVVERGKKATSASKISDYSVARKDVSFLLDYTSAVLDDDLVEANTLLDQSSVSKRSSLPSRLQQDLSRRQANKHDRYTLELTDERALDKVVSTILDMDSLAYETFFNHAESLRDFADANDYSTEYLDSKVNDISAMQLDKVSSYDLEDVLSNDKKFDDFMGSLLQSKNLESLARAKGFVDTCLLYSSFVSTDVSKKNIIRTKKLLLREIDYEKQLVEKDKHIFSNELVLNGEYMPSDSINPTGLYSYDNGIVVVTNVPWKSNSDGAQLTSAIVETNRILQRQAIDVNPKKYDIDFEGVRPIPYIDEQGKQLFLPIHNGVQVRIYYEKLDNRFFTNKFIDQKVSKEVFFNENLKGYLGSFRVESAVVNVYSNPVRTVMQYTTSDSIYLFEDASMSLSSFNENATFKPDVVYVSERDNSLFSNNEPDLRRVNLTKKPSFNCLYRNTMTALFQNNSFESALAKYRRFFSDNTF